MHAHARSRRKPASDSVPPASKPVDLWSCERLRTSLRGYPTGPAAAVRRTGAGVALPLPLCAAGFADGRAPRRATEAVFLRAAGVLEAADVFALARADVPLPRLRAVEGVAE